MILQALKQYYDRMAADPANEMAPEGWEWKEIPFIIVLDKKTGAFLQIEDTRDREGKKKRAKSFLVPLGVKRTLRITANLLWETATYVFGIQPEDKKPKDEVKSKKAEARTKEQQQAFVGRIEEEIPPSKERDYILAFLRDPPFNVLGKDPSWDEISRTNPILSFRFSGDKELFCQSRIAQAPRTAPNPQSSAGEEEICLVSGERDEIVPVHISIKGVMGAQTSGANIVSFNLAPFCSYGKAQGYNAPVGNKAMFAYTTALNHLLSKDSMQKLVIGDATTVFWSEKSNSAFEKDLPFFFAEPPKDDPSAGKDHVRSLFESPENGSYCEDDGDTRFYVLGLSPNAARLSVRYWENGKIRDFAGRIRQYFVDTSIVKPSSEPDYYSIWRLLVNVAVQGKSDNIPPNLAGDFMRSIFEGTQYPQTLYMAALRAIHSDAQNRVKPPRAALLKACINRRYRNDPTRKEIGMGLDKDQPSTGYQLGRLFSILEKIQEAANPNINATIRERYYGSACSVPVSVFPTLLRLKNFHIAKIRDKPNLVTYYEKLIGETLEHITSFPGHLNLYEQGMFALGYYHQRQDFFTKHSDEQ